MFKQTIFTAVSLISMVSAAQAQYTYYMYTPYQPTPTTQTFQFDSQTGVLTIEGTAEDDDCVIKTFYSSMTVEISSPSGGLQSQTFGPDEVTKIVFNGGDGDDSFEFAYLDYMRNLRQYYGLYRLLECDLNGGNGADFLSGGLDDDILNGGSDGEMDLLEGNDGADLFVRGGEDQWYYNYYTRSYSQRWVSDYDYMMDFTYSEGDFYLWESDLEEYLNSAASESNSTTSTFNTTSLSTSSLSLSGF